MGRERRALSSSCVFHSILRCHAEKAAMTIRAALIINNYGRPRMTKFYSQLPTDRQQALIQLIFQLVSRRDDATVCNFLDAPELTPLLPPPVNDAWSKLKSHKSTNSSQDEEVTSDDDDDTDYWIHYDAIESNAQRQSATHRWRPDDELRVIYRHYATLYFVLVVDQSESELGILDLIQVIVEALDRSFENVCELDLIFHFDEVHAVVDQIIQGGLVLETNIEKIAEATNMVRQARKASAQGSTGAMAAFTAAQNASSYLAPQWNNVSLSSIAERGSDALSALQQFGGQYWSSVGSGSARTTMRSPFL